MGIEGTFLNIVKALYDKPIANIILKTESMPPTIRNKTRVSTFIILFSIVLEVLVIAIREEKEIKGIQIRKEVKLSLFSDGLILYRKNPKYTTRKLLELINAYSKVVDYKSNTQKSLAFLYTNRENSEEKLRNQSCSPLQQKALNI